MAAFTHTVMSANERKSPSPPVVVYGEVVFDCFPDGRHVLGGAPFNVAWSLKGLGESPLFCSAVGDDPEGRQIRDLMEQWGLSTQCLQTDHDHPTGEVLVTIENNEPSYEICRDRAWDHIADTGLEATGILYHGLLAIRSTPSRTTLRQLVERSGATRFFDINLRPPFVDRDVLIKWIQGSGWLKLNLDELSWLAGKDNLPFAKARPVARELRQRFHVDNVLLTAGAQGALIDGDAGQAEISPAPEPDPFVDTVGAGDAFSAAAIDGIMKGLPVQALIARASRFAARVCGLRGATTRNTSFYRIDHE